MSVVRSALARSAARAACAGVRAQQRRQPGDDCTQALDAIGLRAQFVVENDAAQALDPGVQSLPAVLVEEEPGVGQARPQYPLVAADDRRRVARLDVAHQQKTVDQRPRRVGEGEILLVQLHGQNQAFLRHRQERSVETAHVDGGPLDQRGHFVEQGIGHDRRGIAGGFLQRDDDARAPLGKRRNDLAFALQRRRVGAGIRQAEHRTRQEAMAAGDPSGVEPKRVHRNDVGAVQRQQRMRGTHELHRGAIRALVAHHLGNRQPRQRLVEGVLQAAGEPLSVYHAAQVDVLGLAVRLLEQLIGGIAGLRRQRGTAERGKFLDQSRRRRAGSVEGDLDRHQLLDDLGIRRNRRDFGDGDRQPPRRCIGRDLAAFAQVSARAQAFGDSVGEGISQTPQRLGRQLLGEQFDQQRVGAHRAAAVVAASPAPERSIGKPSASRES